MLTGNEFYVVVRLVTGEQIMSVLQEEDDNYIQLLHPMLVRTIPNFETGKEHVTAAPFCAFTEEESFILDRKNVLFIKPLKQAFVSHYINIVRESEGIRFTPSGREPREVLDHDQIEHLKSIADKISAIEQLRPIADETEEEKHRVFVEGNDTKH
jgi:hypothetical protein